MMRPRTSTLVAGHPLVMVPLFLLHAFLGVAYTYTEGFGWLSLYALVFLGWLANCYKEAARYREWKREWDALDPDHRPPRPIRAGAQWMVAAGIIIGCFWLFLHFDDPTSAAHIIAPMVVVGIPLLWIASVLLRRRNRQRPNSQDWIVSQAISRPLPAPSVAEAFARLPDYCRSPARKDHA
jgi:hypothetical protein